MNKPEKPVKNASPAAPSGKKASTLFPFLTHRMRVYFLLLLALGLYINTGTGDYVLDDVSSITGNRFVQQGLQGIKKIYSTDGLTGYLNTAFDLQGGRYRPFALMSFAMEHELFGNNPHLSHFFNCLIFVFLSFLLFHLLRKYFFPHQPDIAFISALIFIIHPIHTEAVANIKSRDELFSLLFLLLSTLLAFKYVLHNGKNKFHLAWSLFFYFLALLSKENGITFVILLPLMLYCFAGAGLKKAVTTVLPFAGVLLLYLLIRFSVIGIHTNPSTYLLNNPFLNATAVTRLGTIMFCLLIYLKLLFFPYPQSYDYGFNQIPLTDFKNPLVILSVLIYISMLAYAVLTIKNKNTVAFSILFFLVSIFIVSNLAVDIGALIGERLLFQPSVALAIFLGFATVKLSERIKNNGTLRTRLIGALLSFLILVAGYRTLLRNAAWRTEFSLYTTDVAASPNSAMAVNMAGVMYVRLGDELKDPEEKKKNWIRSISYFKRALEIFPEFADPHQNALIAYSRYGAIEEAETELSYLKKSSIDTVKVLEFESYIAKAYNEKAEAERANGNYEKASFYFEKAILHDSTNSYNWFGLGSTCYLTKNYKKAYKALAKSLALNPDFKEAKAGLDALKRMGINPGNE